MAKIRADLIGVTIITTDAGPVMLAAGDEVPEGAVVGDHLTEPEAPTEPAGDEVPEGAAPATPAKSRRR
jgi:hypothetical protein